MHLWIDALEARIVDQELELEGLAVGLIFVGAKMLAADLYKVPIGASLAIIAAVAVPTYQSQMKQTRRADAKTGLMQAAQFLERNYTANNCYNT